MQPKASILLCFSILVASSNLQCQPSEAHELAADSGSPSLANWLTNLRKDERVNGGAGGSRLWAPNSLHLYTYQRKYPSSETQSIGKNQLTFLGSKRSGSALDSLAGVTFGKRSAAPAELINFEPIYGRRFGPPNSMPRVFDMRSTLFDNYDSTSSDVE